MNFFTNVCLVLGVLIFNTTKAIAQNNIETKNSTISLDYSYLSKVPQIQISYHRDLIRKDSNSNTEIILSAFAGLGYGNASTDEGDQDQKFITLGIFSGVQFNKNQRTELGLQYKYKRSRSGFNSSNEEIWDYDSTMRFIVGYRYEDSILVFKIFTYPKFLSPIDKIFLESGFGIGVRF